VTAEGRVTPQEVETAKRDAIHYFITRFDVPREIVYNRMAYDLQGYPEDFVDTYAERIRSVTADDVSSAAKTLLHPDRIRILVVGNPAAMDGSLDSFGSVARIPLESAGTAEPAGGD
jgi:zinc protease